MASETDERLKKMQEIGLARAKASMPGCDEDLLQVGETLRKYLETDTVAGEGANRLASLFNSKAHVEIRLALNILAAEHARQVLQSEKTAAGIGSEDLQFIFGYANLNTAVWNMIDDAGEPVEQMVKRFPELTPERVNAVMPDFGRPSFMASSGRRTGGLEL